ncbi:MDIS1-interacting receptor like kinase 2-like [Macadamia integrifolia]|uniref:MDIS1-interacting receptor like kinase 2-like n=1 Tax=Macadamia integrifolia TaxID=60698 RepID=UPI001C4E60DF|nr:MDIS1-interacting receptor like kinase 2-like [Macadamia integrifolia]
MGSAAEFGALVDACGMAQVPSSGRKFTWSNNRRRGNVSAVLDRCFCNEEWIDFFQDCGQRVLPRIASDHSPLLFTSILSQRPINCPFRFHKFWMEHGDFEQVVATSWEEWVSGNPIFVLMLKLKRLKGVLRNWGREAFPNFNKALEEAKDKLAQVQQTIEINGMDDHLFGLRNSIRSLKTPDGTLVEGNDQIGNYTVQSYEQFYKAVPLVEHVELLETIPMVLHQGNLRNLTILHLFENQLSGRIPLEIGNLANLNDLELSFNLLTGGIPSTLGNLQKFTILNLLENQLSGSIPEEIENLTNLVNLQMGDNHLSGSLRLGLCMSGSLENFTAFNNHLTCLIPKGFKNCTGLVRVRLENNQLVANLSEDSGIYEKLNYIDLSNNQLHGELSSTWGQCQNLQALQMAGNNIIGKIPAELGMLTQLVKLDLSSNYLVGEIPKEFGELTSFLDLTLSSNQLFGILPLEVGRLYSLTNHDLSTYSFKKTV